ncbi:hypothetical protein CDAR_451641 [Caerostris darwini]|uniref:Serine/threonine-protein phosphatase CPPED1 n=1 Tax=Caerostris darwini TaxID=1538125 RepID=A0AAV4VZC4_9ARAC|nr:hypothetical protein CDAR_451641 [Caerostris darwini]
MLRNLTGREKVSSVVRLSRKYIIKAEAEKKGKIPILAREHPTVFVSLFSKARIYFWTMTTDSLSKKAQDGTYPGFEKENGSEWKEPFYFIQGADPQFGMIHFYDSSKNAWDEEMRLTRKAIQLINNMKPKPKFFVVCGDLTHDFQGYRHRIAQEKDFINVFKELDEDIPLVCVCGNHEVNDEPIPSTILNYREKFGDDYFSFYCGGVMFIVLNSQYFKNSSMVKDLAKKHEKWLDKQLKEAKSGKYKHVVIFQHIPWFVRKAEERDMPHNLCSGIRTKMLNKFQEAKVKAIFCGHIHLNAGGFYKDLEVVVTSAIGCQLGMDKSGFRVVKVEEDKLSHKYISIDDAPENLNF